MSYQHTGQDDAGTSVFISELELYCCSHVSVVAFVSECYKGRSTCTNIGVQLHPASYNIGSHP